MLEELWKKAHGIDKWPETEATVSSVVRVPTARRRGEINIVRFSYKTSDGTLLTGIFRADKYTALFEISTGDAFTLRFNPKKPNRYWSDGYGLPAGTGLFVIWALAVTVILAYALSSR